MAAATALRSVLTEDDLRAIIDNAPVFLWSDLPDGFCDFLNQRWLNYFNLSLQEAQGTGWATVLHPDDAAHLLESWQKSVSTGIPFETEARFRRPDGEYRWFLTRADPLRDKMGRIVKWYGTNTDIENLKRTEERLRQSEAYLAEAQRLSHTGNWVYDATTKLYLYWSDESYRIWGFDPLQGIPSRENMWQRIHPDDRDRVWEAVQEALRQKKNFVAEFRLLLPDGTVKYLEATTYHVFSPLGALVEATSTHVDVTERKRAEQALRESEAKIRRLVDANILGICIWNLEGAIVEANEAFLHMLQYGREDVVSDRLRWTDLTPAEWRERDERAVAELRSTGTFQPFEKEYFRKDGSRVPVLIGGALFEQSRNEGVAFVLDLTARKCAETERRRAEEALRESEARARSAFDGIAGLVSILAPDGGVEAANRQFLEYFGSLEWVKNWETNDAVHPEDLPRIAELFKRAIASGVPFQHELRLRRFDGEYRWFENRGVPIRDDSGRIARWYVLLTDIEDRTRALQQLEQMQSDFAHMNRVSMMGELAASLSHEITQPIASARNNARAAQNFLDKQPPDLSEVREALACVVGDTDRAGDIVDRIRDHMKKAPPRKSQFDLNEAINEVITLGRSAIIKNRVWVQTRLSEGLFPVYGDRVQLQQVVLNLLLNAVEAMGSVEAKPRELLISTEQDHRGVLVTVRDSGPGLDPSHLERVFDAFYTTKSSGAGMGLSICRSIIDAHGGRLWAEANEPRGTIFQFTLPAVP